LVGKTTDHSFFMLKNGEKRRIKEFLHLGKLEQKELKKDNRCGNTVGNTVGYLRNKRMS